MATVIENNHLVATVNLLRAAAGRGAFQLVQFKDVYIAYAKCIEIINSKKDIAEQLDEKIVLLLRTTLGIAANKNTGVDLNDYGTVYTLVFDVFDAYLREAGAGAGAEEKK